MEDDATLPELGRWDYVIVGAGSAGCVLGNRLSADPAARVLVLEAGGRDSWHWIHIPVGYLYCMGDPRTDWRLETDAVPGLNGRRLPYPRGRVLGGCSSINGMIYMRGQARDYDQWRQAGNPGWSWSDVLPYFRRSEDHYARDDALHGQGGEWRVEQQRLSWDILDKVQDACVEVGIPRVADFNDGDNFGTSLFQVNQRRGWRLSTFRAFLKPVMGRPNLTVMTGATVRRITFEGRRATGLVIERDGETQRLCADAEVILAAGAIGSPQLLEQSGVGAPGVLGAAGIDVRHALSAVGENLQDHLQIRAVYRLTGADTLNDRVRTIWGKARVALEYAVYRSGPMAMAPSQLGIFARSDPAYETPNLEYHVQPLSLDRFGEPLHTFSAVTMSVCNLRPESRGSVHVRGPEPAAAPAIQPNYLDSDRDRRVAVDGLKLTRRLMATRALAPYAPDEVKPGPEIQDDEDLARMAGDISTTIFHPVGTCRMGADDGAVVDARLRVRGIDGLRVVDASVMPTITSGNTNAPTIMIAEKAADMIATDRRAS